MNNLQSQQYQGLLIVEHALNSRYEGAIIIDELIDNIAPKKHSSFRGLIIFL